MHGGPDQDLCQTVTPPRGPRLPSKGVSKPPQIPRWFRCCAGMGPRLRGEGLAVAASLRPMSISYADSALQGFRTPWRPKTAPSALGAALARRRADLTARGNTKVRCVMLGRPWSSSRLTKVSPYSQLRYRIRDIQPRVGTHGLPWLAPPFGHAACKRARHAARGCPVGPARASGMSMGFCVTKHTTPLGAPAHHQLDAVYQHLGRIRKQ